MASFCVSIEHKLYLEKKSGDLAVQPDFGKVSMRPDEGCYRVTASADGGNMLTCI